LSDSEAGKNIENIDVAREETLLESLASICGVMVVGLFIITFVFQNFEIPSPSMVQTLLVGDHVLVDRINLAPAAKWMPLVHYRNVRRGDIIVFLKPNPETPDLFLVKRVVGVPGDRIHLQSGTLYVNGVAQHEPQITMPTNDGNPRHEYDAYRDDFPSVPANMAYGVTSEWEVEEPNHIQNGELVVPDGKYFAMGDNRLDSLDGRYWGFVPRENIVGRPMFVYWSFETPEDQEEKSGLGDRIAFMGQVALHIFDKTRWSRTFHLIK